MHASPAQKLFSPEAWTESGFEAVQRLPAMVKRYETTGAEAEHLALAFLDGSDDDVAALMLDAADSSAKALRRELDAIARKNPRVSGGGAEQQASVQPSALALARQADAERKTLGDEYLSAEHVLLALIVDKRCGAAACKKVGLTDASLRAAIEQVRGGRRITTRDPDATYDALGKYARDLTASAAEGKLDPVIGRDDEVRRAMTVLSRRTKNNPILIGEPGVGKTAIAEGLAQRIAAGDVPESLRGRRLLARAWGEERYAPHRSRHSFLALQAARAGHGRARRGRKVPRRGRRRLVAEWCGRRLVTPLAVGRRVRGEAQGGAERGDRG